MEGCRRGRQKRRGVVGRERRGKEDGMGNNREAIRRRERGKCRVRKRDKGDGGK